VPFAFVGGRSNLLQLDRLGNLWIGDDTSDGAANFTGRIWFISSGALSNPIAILLTRAAAFFA
jgi:hypothetical protein